MVNETWERGILKRKLVLCKKKRDMGMEEREKETERERK